MLVGRVAGRWQRPPAGGGLPLARRAGRVSHRLHPPAGSPAWLAIHHRMLHDFFFCPFCCPHSLSAKPPPATSAHLLAWPASRHPHPACPSEPQPLEAYEFKHDPRDFKVFWDVRRGLIPIVGAARKPGTSMLLEDVACPVDK